MKSDNLENPEMMQRTRRLYWQLLLRIRAPCGVQGGCIGFPTPLCTGKLGHGHQNWYTSRKPNGGYHRVKGLTYSQTSPHYQFGHAQHCGQSASEMSTHHGTESHHVFNAGQEKLGQGEGGGRCLIGYDQKHDDTIRFSY